MCDGPTGVTGAYGPNDTMYALGRVEKAARQIRDAIGFTCVGYGWGNYYLTPAHPLRRALEALAEFDRRECQYANRGPLTELFSDPRCVDVLPEPSDVRPRPDWASWPGVG